MELSHRGSHPFVFVSVCLHNILQMSHLGTVGGEMSVSKQRKPVGSPRTQRRYLSGDDILILRPFLFAAAGIGIAPIYPTVMALVAKRYPHGSDTAITFVVTMMGIGSVIGNYAIGAIIDLFKHMFGGETANGLLRGLQAGYGFIGLCALLCSVSGVALYRYLSARKELV